MGNPVRPLDQKAYCAHMLFRRSDSVTFAEKSLRIKSRVIINNK